MAAALLQAAVEGLLVGGLYALLGIGFHLMFGVLRRLNLAYGSVIVVAVYLAAVAGNRYGLVWLLVLPVAIAAGILISLLVEKLAFAWIRGDPRVSMVATLGVWMILEELLLHSPGGGRGQPMWNPLEAAILSVGPLAVRADYLVAFSVGIAVCVGVAWLLMRTRVGLAIRTVVEDRALAGLLGMDAGRITRVAFLLAAVVGVIAGYGLTSVQLAVDVHFGMWATLKGLVILVIGGVGHFWGVVVAALGLGLMERLGAELAGPGYRDLVGYALMTGLLSAFPDGIVRGRLPALRKE